MYVTGYVAVIAGGFDYSTSITQDTVTVYSPEAGCVHNLPSLPVPLAEPVLVNLLNQIYLCFGYIGAIQNDAAHKNPYCWKYDFSSQKWLKKASSKGSYYRKPGLVYENKLYMLNDPSGICEVYDPVSDAWTTWGMSTPTVGNIPCILSWRDSFLQMGGELDPYSVRMYNFTTQVWKDLTTRGQQCVGCACIILPQNQNEMLVSGTNWQDGSRADIYNFVTNKWRQVGRSIHSWNGGVMLVSLGNRVFLFEANPTGNQVEEFHYESESWSLHATLVPVIPSAPGIVSIPEAFFSDCIGVY